MSEILIHEHSKRVRGPGGAAYTARAMGVERRDGTWAGWLEFVPVDGDGESVVTGQETSQPNRLTLDYWAGGLEPVYLEGALERALREARKRK